jgi:hypothetical protein
LSDSELPSICAPLSCDTPSDAGSPTGPEAADPDWRALRGRRVTLDETWRPDAHERPGGAATHQGVVAEVSGGDRDDTGSVELTLTRYDGRSLALQPVGRFTVHDDDTGAVVYTPAAHLARTVPAGFVDAVRHVAPEQWDELAWLRGAQAEGVPPDKAGQLVEIAAQVEWECTRDRDAAEDIAARAAGYALAARAVVDAWGGTTRP